jgi:hypothetical protein
MASQGNGQMLLTDQECTALRHAYTDLVRLSGVPYHKWDEVMAFMAKDVDGGWGGVTSTLAAKKAKLRPGDAELVLQLMTSRPFFYLALVKANDPSGEDLSADQFNMTVADQELSQFYSAFRSFAVGRYANLGPLMLDSFEIPTEEIGAWLRATPLIPALRPELWSGDKGHYIAIRIAGDDQFVVEKYDIKQVNPGNSVAEFHAYRSLYRDTGLQNVRNEKESNIERHITGYIVADNSSTFYYFGRVANTQEMRFAIMKPIIGEKIDFIGVRIGGTTKSTPRIIFFFCLQLKKELVGDIKTGSLSREELKKILGNNEFTNTDMIVEQIKSNIEESTKHCKANNI